MDIFALGRQVRNVAVLDPSRLRRLNVSQLRHSGGVEGHVASGRLQCPDVAAFHGSRALGADISEFVHCRPLDLHVASLGSEVTNLTVRDCRALLRFDVGGVDVAGVDTHVAPFRVKLFPDRVADLQGTGRLQGHSVRPHTTHVDVAAAHDDVTRLQRPLLVPGVFDDVR